MNPTFDPVALPGALHDYFRGNPDGRSPLDMLAEREPIRPAYRDRDARLETMDAQGLDRAWMFPTLGMIYEELLKHDPGAVVKTFTAFNRWVQEDWGFAYQDRIFAAPYLSLCDPAWAQSELRWALDQGARMIVMRPAAVWTDGGVLPPTDPSFDRFWAQVDEAGITVVVHAGDSGHSSNGYADDSFSSNFSGGEFRPTIKFFAIERAAYDFLITLTLDRMFDRFPNLRVASVENGSEFLPDLFRKLGSMQRKLPGWFDEDPSETFRRHVWINPFWEDDAHEIVDLMGADRVIFGSDWPHIEGTPSPLDYAVELKEFSDTDRRLILNDNAAALTQLRPTG